MSERINVTRSSLPPFEEYCAEIRPLWDTRWLTNGGVKVMEFQHALKQYLDAPYAIPFSNGHLALEAALNAMGLKGEVITTPFTFASTIHAIVRSGLTPVFADIRPDDFTLDANGIEALVNEKTCAILPVHVYGHPCDNRALNQVAQKHNLKVIYDAAQAFGVTVNGQSIANMGDASIFSFHATKVFHTIEGGAVACADAALAEKVALERNFGFVSETDSVVAGGNAKMSEFHAAMGLCNLRYVDREIARRARAALRYIERLSGVKGIGFPRTREGTQPNYSYFPVLFDGFACHRDEVAESLTAVGVFPRKYFYPLVSGMTAYRGRYDVSSTPVAQRVSERILCLPLYADLETKDVDFICDAVLRLRSSINGCERI